MRAGYKRAFEGPPEDSECMLCVVKETWVLADRQVLRAIGVGGLPKRQQLAQAEDELDDDELLALAFSQPWPPPASSAQPKSQSLPADDTVSKARVANATQGGSPGEGQLNLGPDIDPLGNVMDTAEPGSRPLATTDEVALCLQQLQIQYDPLAIDGPIIQTTAEDGTPAFCLIEEPAEAEPRLPAAKGQLLSRPISQLLAEAEQQSFEKALTESRAMYTQAAKHQQQQRFQQQQQPQHQHEQQTCQELWVDKYRPEGFLELLSNEQVNRNVLDWVKAWDSTVFGFAGAKPARGIGEKPAQTASIDMTVDQKLLLLSGPPGTASLSYHIAPRPSCLCDVHHLYPLSSAFQPCYQTPETGHGTASIPIQSNLNPHGTSLNLSLPGQADHPIGSFALCRHDKNL